MYDFVTFIRYALRSAPWWIASSNRGAFEAFFNNELNKFQKSHKRFLTKLDDKFIPYAQMVTLEIWIFWVEKGQQWKQTGEKGFLLHFSSNHDQRVSFTGESWSSCGNLYASSRLTLNTLSGVFTVPSLVYNSNVYSFSEWYWYQNGVKLRTVKH